MSLCFCTVGIASQQHAGVLCSPYCCKSRAGAGMQYLLVLWHLVERCHNHGGVSAGSDVVCCTRSSSAWQCHCAGPCQVGTAGDIQGTNAQGQLLHIRRKYVTPNHSSNSMKGAVYTQQVPSSIVLLAHESASTSEQVLKVSHYYNLPTFSLSTITDCSRP